MASPLFSRILELHERDRVHAHALADVPKIHVNEGTKAVAELYERGRNTLEYHDADTVRRIAIERALRRLLAFGMLGGSTDNAENLLKELIRAGYFQNDSIPEDRSDDVARIIRRFLAAHQQGIPQADAPLFLSLTAIAIEDAAVPEEKEVERRFVQFAFQTLRDRITWRDEERSDRRQTAMLYAAVWRDILNADERRCVAALVRNAVPAWEEQDDSERVARLLPDVLRAMAASRILQRLPEFSGRRKVARAFSPAFVTLRDVLALHPDDISEVTSSSLLFEERLEETIDARAQRISRELKWSALRATLYVFLTKVTVGMAIEVPYELFVLSSFHVPVFFANLLVPPLIMLIMAMSIPLPSSRTKARIVDTALVLAFEDGMLAMPQRSQLRSSMRVMLYSIAAAVLTVGMLSLLVRVLFALEFSWFAVGVFVFFMSMVSLFAWRVRKPLRDVGLAAPPEGFWGTAGDIVAFPFLAVGRLLSNILGSFSVVLFMLDVFIESPLKLFLGFVEDWTAFLREKREEFLEERA